VGQPSPEPPPPVAIEELQIPEKVGPVRVGLLLPLSGQAGPVGKDMLDAAQLALFDVGETDLILVPADTGGTPDGAKLAAQKVIDAGAELILGPLFSTSTQAISSLARQEGLKVLTFSNDARVAGEGGYVLGLAECCRWTLGWLLRLLSNRSNRGRSGREINDWL